MRPICDAAGTGNLWDLWWVSCCHWQIFLFIINIRLNDLDLSDAEKESVAYIAGAVLKNVGSKLCELKRKIVSNGQDVATVDKDITILNACKGTRSDGWVAPVPPPN